MRYAFTKSTYFNYSARPEYNCSRILLWETSAKFLIGKLPKYDK